MTPKLIPIVTVGIAILAGWHEAGEWYDEQMQRQQRKREELREGERDVMVKRYTHLLIRSDEDGRCVRFLDGSDLEKCLRDPRGEHGVESFLTAEDLHERNLDPQMWGEAALLVKIEIVKVRPVTTAWAIAD